MSRERHDWDWGMSAWMRACYGGDGAFLGERAVRRVAQYHRAIANLTRQGSAEPRLWIGALQSFWSGMAEDYGDYLRRYAAHDADAELVEVAAGGPPIVIVIARISETSKIDEQLIELPTNLLDPSFAEATLKTNGFFLVNRCLLRPGHHVIIYPEKVHRDDRTCKIRFMNLPDDLTAGMTLVGTVVAERKPAKSADASPGKAESGKSESAPPSHVLVAVVQLKII